MLVGRPIKDTATDALLSNRVTSLSACCWQAAALQYRLCVPSAQASRYHLTHSSPIDGAGGVMVNVICGQGRLGSRVSALLASHQQTAQALRIDRERGLVNPAGPVPTDVARLILCFVPRHPDGGSGWAGLLNGLQTQVERKALQIQQVLLVSSTAVYESYERGWVTAASPVSAASARSAGLIEAEHVVRALTADSCIVRLAGITGPGYERYDPVAMSQQQARHAIDVRAAAQLIAKLALRPAQATRTELITDGYIYYQQQRYPAEPTQPVLATLAEQQRLMRPSMVAPPAN